MDTDKLYEPNKEIFFPYSHHLIGELKSKEQWLSIMPKNLQSKFSEWFTEKIK